MSQTFRPVVRALRTEQDYNRALSEIAILLDSPHPEGSPKYERLKLLAILVEAYEDEQEYRMEPATPQEAVAFMLEQRGMTRSDLASVMGGRSRVSDFFSGKRTLSTGQIVKLHALLHIPADLLLPMPSARGKVRPSPARAA